MIPWRGPQQLLDLFSIRQDSFGGRAFLVLVWQRFRGRPWAEAEAEAVKVAGGSLVAVRSNVLRAVRPLVEADPIALDALGLNFRFRNVRGIVDCVAWRMAHQRIIAGGDGGGGEAAAEGVSPGAAAETPPPETGPAGAVRWKS